MPADQAVSASVSRSVLLGKFLAKVFDDVTELGGILSVGFNQRLVRSQNVSFLLCNICIRHRFLQAAWRRYPGISLNGEELVEAEVLEEVGISFVDVHRPKVPLADLPQTKGDPGKRSHKGRIHELARIEIHDELPMAALDHLLDELFDPRAILKRPTAINFQPDRASDMPHKNRRRSDHNIYMNQYLKNSWYVKCQLYRQR